MQVVAGSEVDAITPRSDRRYVGPGRRRRRRSEVAIRWGCRRTTPCPPRPGYPATIDARTSLKTSAKTCTIGLAVAVEVPTTRRTG